jgi:hypothetical protein
VVDFASLPDGVQTTVVPLAAVDRVSSRGVLYTRGGEKTVVCLSHPRGDVSRHFVVPWLLQAGYAAYIHQCRGLNNDVDCEHEKLLLDLAAGFTFLKETRGFERIVLCGHSGGGSLMCFYQQQASTGAPGRLSDTPAGEQVDLNAVNMPRADGVVLLAAHPGEGPFMLDGIDPSVTDENDPLSLDPALDMYNPANGFKQPPAASRYAPEFVDRYRAGQLARVARLNALALSRIRDQARFRRAVNDLGFAGLPLEERIYLERRSVVGHYMIVYRTEANLAYCDTSIHAWKSTRDVGSIIGLRPDKLNYAPGGFARYITPRAWLSSWSALSSRAKIIDTIKSIREPLLMISFTADNGCFPDDMQAQLASCPSTDKTLHFVDAEHYGRPLPEREKALNLLIGWLRERFPVSDLPA